MLKLNLGPIIYKKISLQYERILSDKESITLTGTYRPISPFDPMVLLGKIPEAFTNRTTSQKSFTTALRIYNKAKEARDSYFEFYAGFCGDETNYSWEKYVGDEIIKFNARENSYTLGVLYGIQIVHGKNLSIDFMIVSLGIGINQYNVTSNFEPQFPNKFINYYQKELYNTDIKSIYSNAKEIQWTNNEMNIRGRKLIFSPGIFGIKLGWRF